MIADEGVEGMIFFKSFGLFLLLLTNRAIACLNIRNIP